MTSPLSPETEARCRAAADAASAALHARPPARCHHCGPTTSWLAQLPSGAWRCGRCETDTFPSPPTPDEVTDARLRARRDAEAEAASERRTAVQRFIQVETLRDQRPLRSLLPGLRAALLHRFCPDRYPATANARQWLEGSPVTFPRAEGPRGDGLR
jgi:hypothetical protein